MRQPVQTLLEHVRRGLGGAVLLGGAAPAESAGIAGSVVEGLCVLRAGGMQGCARCSGDANVEPGPPSGRPDRGVRRSGRSGAAAARRRGGVRPRPRGRPRRQGRRGTPRAGGGGAAGARGDRRRASAGQGVGDGDRGGRSRHPARGRGVARLRRRRAPRPVRRARRRRGAAPASGGERGPAEGDDAGAPRPGRQRDRSHRRGRRRAGAPRAACQRSGSGRRRRLRRGHHVRLAVPRPRRGDVHLRDRHSDRAPGDARGVRRRDLRAARGGEGRDPGPASRRCGGRDRRSGGRGAGSCRGRRADAWGAGGCAVLVRTRGDSVP